jgi:hypothetical protein
MAAFIVCAVAGPSAARGRHLVRQRTELGKSDRDVAATTTIGDADGDAAATNVGASDGGRRPRAVREDHGELGLGLGVWL